MRCWFWRIRLSGRLADEDRTVSREATVLSLTTAIPQGWGGIFIPHEGTLRFSLSGTSRAAGEDQPSNPARSLVRGFSHLPRTRPALHARLRARRGWAAEVATLEAGQGVREGDMLRQRALTAVARAADHLDVVVSV